MTLTTAISFPPFLPVSSHFSLVYSSSYSRPNLTVWWSGSDLFGNGLYKVSTHNVAQQVAQCTTASAAATDIQFLVNNYVVFSFFSKTVNGNEGGSPIKLLYTKVQLNSEGALLFQPVEAYWLSCAQPLCTKRWLFFFSCYPPSVGLS